MNLRDSHDLGEYVSVFSYSGVPQEDFLLRQLLSLSLDISREQELQIRSQRSAC
jgi:hypothetical protein